MKLANSALSLLILTASLSFSQNTSGLIKGAVTDATGAMAPGASCVLTSKATGAARTTTSGPDGAFSIPELQPGTYDFAVQAAGFKSLVIRDIVLTTSEIRNLGNLKLEIGQMAESVTVTSEGAPVQLASAERSGLVSGQQLNDIAVKGRDFVSFLTTMAGIVDTSSAGRESFTRNALTGIHINGGRDSQVLLTIDGMPSIDAGNNGTTEQPNMDSIAEVKVLTSNYQAEFGRNAGGTVTVVTKSGSRQFHGAGYDFYRHESLNANSFMNNRSATPKSPYRYRITGYSLGGPLYIPRKFNKEKEKLFFYFSEELVGSRVDYAPKFVTMPTALERNGDFSQTYDVSGALIQVKDPTTGKQFPGNIIPKDRFNALGQNILNFFPLPNYSDPDPNNRYRWNYRSLYSGAYPRRQEMGRVDGNFWPSLQIYYRIMNDADDRLTPWGNWVNGSVNYNLTPVAWSRPARSQAGHATKIFSPTLVAEATFGRSTNAVLAEPVDPTVLERSRMGNPPQWFQDSLPGSNWIPGATFGALPTNAVNATLSARLPVSIPNTAYTFSGNVSKIWKSHSIKAGVYVERNYKIDIASTTFRGVFNFARDVNNPFDSGFGFSNALLGNFQSYTEATNQSAGQYLLWNVEPYIQDNWRVSKRLTLDIGLRFYHDPPISTQNHVVSSFDRAIYSLAKAPLLYMPALDATRKRVAQDPLTGAFAPAALIGQFVPGSGDPANGSRVSGLNGNGNSLTTNPAVAYGPRFGFAWDVLGNGKTAVRGGFGMFKDRSSTGYLYSATGNPPVTTTPILYYGNLSTFAQSGGVVGPSNLSSSSYGFTPIPTTMNFSLALQRQIGTTTFEASYVGSLSRHQAQGLNINAIPMYARFDPKNQDPTQTSSPLPDNFLRPYRGYGNINVRQYAGSSNYNSLQITANRRFTRGLQMGAAFTWSKILTVSDGDGGGLSPYFPARSRNYGPAGYDQPRALVFNYIYGLPKLGTRLGYRPAKWVLDDWQLSGITSFLSGNPFTPTFSTIDGQDTTGSTEGATITVLGDPRLDKSQRTLYRNFKTEMFARTPQRSFGNAGVNILYGPGLNNWDLAVSKRIPLFSEARFIQFRGEFFNAFNHTQFSDLYTVARFDKNGAQVDPNFGAYSASRNPRNIQLSIKVVF